MWVYRCRELPDYSQTEEVVADDSVEEKVAEAAAKAEASERFRPRLHPRRDTPLTPGLPL